MYDDVPVDKNSELTKASFDLTDNLREGVVVPMPTLPELSKTIADASFIEAVAYELTRYNLLSFGLNPK